MGQGLSSGGAGLKGGSQSLNLGACHGEGRQGGGRPGMHGGITAKRTTLAQVTAGCYTCERRDNLGVWTNRDTG